MKANITFALGVLIWTILGIGALKLMAWADTGMRDSHREEVQP